MARSAQGIASQAAMDHSKCIVFLWLGLQLHLHVIAFVMRQVETKNGMRVWDLEGIAWARLEQGEGGGRFSTSVDDHDGGIFYVSHPQGSVFGIRLGVNGSAPEAVRKLSGKTLARGLPPGQERIAAMDFAQVRE